MRRLPAPLGSDYKDGHDHHTMIPVIRVMSHWHDTFRRLQYMWYAGMFCYKPFQLSHTIVYIERESCKLSLQRPPKSEGALVLAKQNFQQTKQIE